MRFLRPEWRNPFQHQHTEPPESLCLPQLRNAGKVDSAKALLFFSSVRLAAADFTPPIRTVHLP